MLRPRLLPFIALLAALSAAAVSATPAVEHQIITVRAIPSAETGSVRLVVVDGGYDEGLELGQTGTLPMTASGVSPAVLEVFDIDCHEAYCIARPRPEADPTEFLSALDAATVVEFAPLDTSAEELKQRAIRAISEGNYRCAIARLTRLLETDPENASYQSALKRSRTKLQEQSAQVPDSVVTRMETAKLPLYNTILSWYFRQNRYDRMLEAAERILRIEPENGLAANYRSIAASHLVGATMVTAHTSTPVILDTAPLHGPDSADVIVDPEFTYRRAARYPRECRDEGVVGRVWLKVLIDPAGKVLQTEVLQSSGDSRLDDAARASSWFCKFKPCVRDGQPAEAWVAYNVDFGLDRK